MGEQSGLIRSLGSPEAYPHDVDDVRVVETHISWVVLTGRLAYKIKKPVELPFLDFSSLEKRKHFCDEELRLNRRMAPELYLEVVPITGSPESPCVGGNGEPIEYALKMVQFPDDARLDRALDGVSAADMTRFAERLADFHAAADRRESSHYGNAEAISGTVEGNLEQLESVVDAAELEVLRAIGGWLRAELRRRSGMIDARAGEGMVRECHGDLHLSNMIALDDGITAFDCLEFDPALRWVDVIDEVAFLMMDLLLRDRRDLAFVFANDYLAASGDYSALELLDLYLAHRSLVRAKVAGIARAQTENDERARARSSDRLRQHLRFANELTAARRPVLVLMHGLPASGKSWLAERLVTSLPGFCVRSDLERKRLAGLEPDESSGSGLASGLYAGPVTEATYARLEAAARACLAARRHVILDATFGSRALRDRFYAFARETGVRYVLVDCQAPRAVLEERIRERSAGPSVSEADLSVLQYALESHEPLESGEHVRVIAVDTSSPTDVADLAAEILDGAQATSQA